MKRLLFYCFLFAGILLLFVAVPLEYLLRQVPNTYKYKYEWMQKHAEEVEILILGPSFSYYGLRPELMEGTVFNLANVAQPLRIDQFLLNYWADRYRRLQTVIVPVSPSVFFTKDLDEGIFYYLCRYYKMYMDYDLYPDYPPYNLELSHHRTAVEKFYKLVRRDSTVACDEFGWATDHRLSQKNEAKWNLFANAWQWHRSDRWDYVEFNLAILRQMADFCQRRGIRLVLITTPCWHTYYDHSDEKQLAEIYKLIHELQSTYGVLYLDYLRDQRFVFDDFFDSVHLTDVGAAKLTTILNADLAALPAQGTTSEPSCP